MRAKGKSQERHNPLQAFCSKQYAVTEGAVPRNYITRFWFSRDHTTERVRCWLGASVALAVRTVRRLLSNPRDMLPGESSMTSWDALGWVSCAGRLNWGAQEAKSYPPPNPEHGKPQHPNLRAAGVWRRQRSRQKSTI